jgi:hypothetical protein
LQQSGQGGQEQQAAMEQPLQQQGQ